MDGYEETSKFSGAVYQTDVTDTVTRLEFFQLRTGRLIRFFSVDSQTNFSLNPFFETACSSSLIDREGLRPYLLSLMLTPVIELVPAGKSSPDNSFMRAVRLNTTGRSFF